MGLLNGVLGLSYKTEYFTTETNEVNRGRAELDFISGWAY